MSDVRSNSSTLSVRGLNAFSTRADPFEHPFRRRGYRSCLESGPSLRALWWRLHVWRVFRPPRSPKVSPEAPSPAWQPHRLRFHARQEPADREPAMDPQPEPAADVAGVAESQTRVLSLYEQRQCAEPPEWRARGGA